MNENDTTLGSHRQWAQFRLSVIGTLLSSPPPKGELATEIRNLTNRNWRHPITGINTRFEFSTIETWFYQAKGATDPIAKLRWKTRSDLGRSRTVSEVIAAEIMKLHEKFPFWSYQLMTDNLKALLTKKPDLGKVPGYQSVRRYMKRRGLTKMRKPPNWDRPSTAAAVLAAATKEVRSWEREYFNSLWHLDYHTGPKKIVMADGTWATPFLLAIMDDHSRLVCHLQWFTEQTAENLVHGFIQALMKRQVPCELMEDNGSPMISKEFQAGLAATGIELSRIQPGCPYQNGKNEFFWNQIDGRLMAMLDHYPNMTLKILNDLTQAWVEMEYNRRWHSEIKTTPNDRYLNSKDVGRPCPDPQILKFRFQREETRKLRRSDCSISLEGQRYEIPSRLRHIERLTVKYAAWDLGFVHIVDPRTGEPMARINPVDKIKNGDSIRRPVENPIIIRPQPLTTELPPLLQQYVEEYAAQGLKPAYIPKDEHK